MRACITMCQTGHVHYIYSECDSVHFSFIALMEIPIINHMSQLGIT